jgi:hypothetical protein
MILFSYPWTENELCRHVLITGDTGCGKTTPGFNPMLQKHKTGDGYGQYGWRIGMLTPASDSP